MINNGLADFLRGRIKSDFDTASFNIESLG